MTGTNKKYACVESVTVIHFTRYIFRVWREEPYPQEAYDNLDLFKCIDDNNTPEAMAVDLAEHLCEMSRVNAVEVTDEITKCGTVIYPVWP